MSKPLIPVLFGFKMDPNAFSTLYCTDAFRNTGFPAVNFFLLFFPPSGLAGTSPVASQRLDPAGGESDGATRRSSPHLDHADLSRREHQQRADAVRQQQQMKILEWENRMKVLAWEQELVREKTRAARQKEKAFRMKKSYYKAKLKRMGEDVPPSSSSSDDEAKSCGQSG